MNKEYERLKDFLNYDSETGIFTWKERQRKAGAIRSNGIAGSISHGYVQIKFNRQFYRAHKIAWFFIYGEVPKNHLDHINGIRSDNRISNLREVSRAENSQNYGKPKTNTSGYMGVCWSKQLNKWMASISIGNKSKYLGYFDDPEQAHLAYLKAKAALHPTANLHRVAASPQHLPIIG